MRRTWRILITTVALLVTVVALAAVVVAVVVPRVAGATPFTILTGSMRPDLPPGTLVVVRPVDEADLGVGDVVTYQLRSGDPTVVTHRIVAQGVDGDGKTIFRTQGDANDVPDEKPVQPVQVRGRLWYSVPYLGRVNTYLNGEERQITMTVVVTGLLLYAAYMLTSAGLDRRRRRHEREEVDA